MKPGLERTKNMKFRVRTTDAFPKYLMGNFWEPKDAVWTRPDTWKYTYEDQAEEFNLTEAECCIDELKTIGVQSELA